MADDAERLIVLVEARIRDLEKNMQKASGTADRNYSRMKRGSRSATRQMEQDMIRSTARINQALASTSTQIGALGRTFVGGFVGGMFAGGVAGLVHGIGRVNAEMAKIADTAKVVGMSAEHLQRLRYGFEQTGVSVSDVDTGMRRFARRIGEAANGGGVLHDVLKANNIQLRNADGSMRSQIDLLRDYANLIQNAGSHQERLALAFKAFDVGGAAMVQALENGADGLDKLMDKADEAGGVISDELIERAAELDREFNDLWRNFEMWAKSAIISVSVALRDGLLKDINAIGSALRDMVNDPSWHNAGRVLFGDEFMGDENVNRVAAIERRISRLTDMIALQKENGFDAIEAERELAIARAQLEEEVQRIMAGGGGGEITLPPISITATPTIIPGGKDDADKRAGSRNRAAEAALREQQRINELIDSLAHELSLVGQSDVEKAKANASRQAGAAATDEQRRQIEMLVEAIHEETEAHKAAQEAAEGRQKAFDNLFQMAGDGLLSIMDGSVKAEDAVKKLAVQLALAAAQAALLGTGPLAGLFGSFGGASPYLAFAQTGQYLFSQGTANTGGQKGQPRGIVHGQEAVIPLPSGGKVPVQLQGGAGARAGETRVAVDVGVSVDEDGNLKAYVRNVSQETSARTFGAGIVEFARNDMPGLVNQIANDPHHRG